MKISELIKKLELIYEEYGEMEVYDTHQVKNIPIKGVIYDRENMNQFLRIY